MEYYVDQPFKFYHLEDVDGYEIIKTIEPGFEDACNFIMNNLTGY